MKKILMIAGFLLLSATLNAQEITKTWNFDKNNIGVPPGEFSIEAGDWKIISDSTAPSKGNALAQLANSSSGIYNLILVGNASYQNVDISVKMKAVKGKSDQGGGIVWRAIDSKNYYVVRYNPLEDNFRLYKVVKGARSEPLQDVTIKSKDGWHDMRVTAKGDYIECYYDGKKYMDYHDSTFVMPGKIGLWTKADAQSLFDDLTVRGK